MATSEKILDSLRHSVKRTEEQIQMLAIENKLHTVLKFKKTEPYFRIFKL